MSDVTVLNSKSLVLTAFLRAVAMHLTRSERCFWNASEGVYYVGAGYWRLRPVYEGGAVWDADAGDDPPPPGRVVGVALINPDRTHEERAAVAKALSILVF